MWLYFLKFINVCRYVGVGFKVYILGEMKLIYKDISFFLILEILVIVDFSVFDFIIKLEFWGGLKLIYFLESFYLFGYDFLLSLL